MTAGFNRELVFCWKFLQNYFFDYTKENVKDFKQLTTEVAYAADVGKICTARVSPSPKIFHTPATQATTEAGTQFWILLDTYRNGSCRVSCRK